MRIASVCSGIGGAELAFDGLGTHAFMSEIDPFARTVLRQHFPHIPLHGDFTEIRADAGPVDVLVGGTPCQSFSIAGLRGGMADARGNLALEFLRLADRLKPRFVVWENVPGVLSVNDGKDFTCFLDGLEAIGYVADIDILDAQFFGLAQRRRRVFVCAERAESILSARTLSSGLTIAQCLIETLLLTLAVLSSRSVPECESLAFDASTPAHSLQRRMRLFGLDQAERASMLEQSLVALHRWSGCEREGSVSIHGKTSAAASGTSEATRSNASKEGMETWRAECPNTARSWNVTLAEALRIASECITSTATSDTTESRIYTCARTLLHIAAHIDQSMDSSPCFWSAASSASIALKAFTNYARSAVSDLFTDLEWLQPWHDFLSQAERADDAFGHLGDWNYSSKVLPFAESLRGHPSPSREARQRIAATLASRADSGSVSGSVTGRPWDDSGDGDARLVAAALTNSRSSTQCPNEDTTLIAYGGNRQSGLDFETETFVTHSLRADGFDASEDGTGRGTPLIAFHGSQDDPDASGNVTHPLGTNQGFEACVAFHQNQRAEVTTNDTTGALNSGGGKPGHGYPAAQIGSVVRRLTPTECERLQGYPEIKKSATILVCSSDRQKTAVLAEARSLKSLPSAWIAAESDAKQSANPVEPLSSISLLGQDWPVALCVQIGLERSVVRLLRAGRCLWSASIVEPPDSSPLTMPLDAFARLLAYMPIMLANVTHVGEAEELQNTTPSTHQRNGSRPASVCGQEIAALAIDAERLAAKTALFTKSTTSAAGLSSQSCDTISETWSYCVAAAIISFILEPIQSGHSFALRIEATAGWTAVTYRGKSAADGNRYRALGNAFAVPTVRWIARRIAASAVSRTAPTEAAA